jgi:hypothetical protein
MKPNLQLKELRNSPERLPVPMNIGTQAESRRIDNILSTLLFYLSILFFIIGFNFSDTPLSGGWTQQFMPDLGGRNITDVFFLDSLTGWAVTNAMNQNPDTAFVLRTTNSGANWIIQYRKIQQYTGFYKVKFLDLNTGYACGVTQFNGEKGLQKTTDGGSNWISLNVPDQFLTYLDMSILSQDTIWLVNSEPTTGGVFFTSNGGVSWIHQLNIGSNNPDRIYMYNARIGFISNKYFNTAFYRTTDGGNSWILQTGESAFNDMFLIDSLPGWKTPL